MKQEVINVLKKLNILIVITLCSILVMPVMAKTRDGETPSVEAVCDLESGAAFGLCNAYCEAMDCDLANDGDPNTVPAASTLACLKVYDNFMQLRGTAPPCEAALGVCGDGVEDVGEECDDGNTASGDGCDSQCFIEGGARCGNNICETGDGENCENCAADCNGNLSGAPSRQFCCGGLSSSINTVDCSDSRCTSGDYQCATHPVPSVLPLF